jgi:hypothetical protein
MKKALLSLFAAAFALLLFSGSGFAQKKTFIRDYIYQASERDSKVTARAAAVQEMQTLLLQEIGQAVQSEQTLKRLSVAKDGKETFSEDFSQKIMAITAGFVEMKILQESWNGKTYYIEAQMTVDPKEVSQRVAEILDGKQKEKEPEGAQKREREESAKAEQAKVEAKEKEMEEAKPVRGWYQPKAFGVDLGFMLLPNERGSKILSTYWNLGIRSTRNISPNVGFDIFKLNLGVNYYHIESIDLFSFFTQLLTGIRFATNRFGRSKNAYFYTSLRAGVGLVSYDYYDHYYRNSHISLAIATELDAGIHFKYFFLGATINHNFFNPAAYMYSPEYGDVDKIIRRLAWGLRFGLDFGKRKSY